MKKIMSVLCAVIFSTLVVTLHVNAAEASDRGVSKTEQKTSRGRSKQQLVEPVSTIPEVSNANNDLFVKILENAQTLVRQIQENKLDAAERKLALVEITRAENSLSKNAKTPLLKNICAVIEQHTQTIKDESKKFAGHRKPLIKYNPVPAETALTALANEIKKASGDLSESFVVKTYQSIERLNIEIEGITKQANKIINDTSLQAAKGEITPTQAAHIIGKQKNIIEQAQQKLAKEKENAQKSVAQNDMQASYLSRVATGIYNVGAGILSPLKAGYGSTEQEKEVARAIIAALEEQIHEQTVLFNEHMQQQGLDAQQKQVLANKHKAVIQELSSAIHDQKLITGDAMSTSRKLFWGAVAGVGIGAAAYYGYQKLAPTVEMPQIPLESESNMARRLDPGTSLTNSLNVARKEVSAVNVEEPQGMSSAIESIKDQADRSTGGRYISTEDKPYLIAPQLGKQPKPVDVLANRAELRERLETFVKGMQDTPDQNFNLEGPVSSESEKFLRQAGQSVVDKGLEFGKRTAEQGAVYARRVVDSDKTPDFDALGEAMESRAADPLEGQQ